MLKRCNYCMILIILIVNTSEFAYFFFKSGEGHEGRTDCLGCSHRVAFVLSSLSQTVVVSACRAIAFMSAL